MIAAWDVKPTKADNQMSRIFSQHRPGNFCIFILEHKTPYFNFHFELLNLGNNQVEIQGRMDRYKSHVSEVGDMPELTHG
jgi:hypothetical protein